MTIPQAADFIAESEALHARVAVLVAADFGRATQFKGWTVEDIIGHLHYWNRATLLALHDPPAFADLARSLPAELAGGGLRAFERRALAGRHGRALLEEWRDGYRALGESFAAADPAQRLPWLGPDMSARSSVTARQMETWAHGQAIFDLLGTVRSDTDRLRNIAQLGLSTFGWSFRNRALPVPAAVPRVTLTAPSGAIWDWQADNPDDWIRGSAAEFCQVVTQTRHRADTRLELGGAVATHWMAIAQCFAGPPVDPPAPGTRFTARQVPAAPWSA